VERANWLAPADAQALGFCWKIIMKIIIALFLICVSTTYANETCKCRKAKQTDKTCWGWDRGHSEINGGTVKEIRGRVVAGDGSPVAGTLIEVYEHPELDLDIRKRRAACRTDENGAFCFRGLSPGRYELRGSCASGFDAGHTIVNLVKKKKLASTREIFVVLNISQ
jgi:hypothetical protein